MNTLLCLCFAVVLIFGCIFATFSFHVLSRTDIDRTLRGLGSLDENASVSQHLNASLPTIEVKTNFTKVIHKEKIAKDANAKLQAETQQSKSELQTLIFIFSARGHQSRRNAIRDSWSSDCDFCYFVFCGNARTKFMASYENLPK